MIINYQIILESIEIILLCFFFFLPYSVNLANYFNSFSRIDPFVLSLMDRQ